MVCISLSLRRQAHRLLAESLMHMAHKTGNMSGVMKSISLVKFCRVSSRCVRSLVRSPPENIAKL